jgi:hypothetical protein
MDRDDKKSYKQLSLIFCWSRISLLKWKDQYSLPLCTYKFIFAAFNTGRKYISFFTKQAILKRSSELSKGFPGLSVSDDEKETFKNH